ncbi:glycosyltransferase [Shewanella surugensis]|uniref:Glycosyltransferase n=1 Tax=Shewanella surugensis TaxID=212020 RepID=A0ABT0LJL7_9GAMM|nr:glycosyltransferase [Shewanella surugensis]MCL1127779.1 glycosyltransferase [Shewanella surugensis]
MTAKFSIIIPCYNNSDLLLNTLHGYSKQTYSIDNFEVILIDNNSSCNEMIHCYHQYKDKFNLSMFFRPKLESSFSLNSARNIGVNIANNEWNVFSDSDCIPSPYFLSEINKEIENNGKNICLTGIREFIHADNIDINRMNKENNHLDNCPRVYSPTNYGLLRDRRLGKIELLPNTEHPWGHFYGCNMVFRKQDILNVGRFDEHYDGSWGYDDIDLAYKVITELDIKPIFMNNATVYHQDKIDVDVTVNNIENKTTKTNNRNYQYICNRINGYYEFSMNEFKRFRLKSI